MLFLVFVDGVKWSKIPVAKIRCVSTTALIPVDLLYLNNEKMGPWLFRVYWALKITQLCGDYNKPF